nr:uncharacterized protein LOC129429909 [Misgurnus anguillicaudatus]
MAKERAQFFSAAEQELLLEGYAEFQTLIKTQGNTSKAAKTRREGWQKVADKLNAATTGGPLRTLEQVKIKYKNILQNATKKRAEQLKTGDGPAPPCYTAAEELALGLNVDWPIVSGIPEGISSLDTQPGTSSSTFITVSHNTPTLLPVPMQVVAEACADSEATLSDDCPLKEEPESTSAERTDPEMTEGDVQSLYKRSLQHKLEYYELKKKKMMGEIELQDLMKKKVTLEIELLQKEVESKR